MAHILPVTENNLESEIKRLESIPETLSGSQELLLYQLKKELSLIKKLDIECADMSGTPEEFERLVNGMKVLIVEENTWKAMSESILLVAKIKAFIEENKELIKILKEVGEKCQ